MWFAIRSYNPIQSKYSFEFNNQPINNLLEDISFNAGGDEMPDVYLNINADYVKEHLKKTMNLPDPHKYIL